MENCIKKQGRPPKGKEKLVQGFYCVKKEHLSLVQKMINELVKPYR